MATTTATSHQQRYRDFSGVPEITAPTAGPRGARRDYMAQANKHSSRQTMTTVGSSTRFSNNNSELERHSRLLDSSNSNNYTPSTSSKSIRTQEDVERQRRAEENAAFVKMLEEESFMLQGGQLPKKQQKERRDRDRSSSVEELEAQAFPHPNAYSRRQMYEQQDRAYSHSSSRSGRSSRYSQQPSHSHSHQQAQQGSQKPYHPHHLYAPYHQIEDDEEEDDAPRSNRHDQRNVHNRDIPLQLDMPGRGVVRGNSKNSRSSSSFIPPNPLVDQQQKEIEFNLDFDDMPRSTHDSDRRHPSQLRLLAREPKQRSMSNDLSPRPSPQQQRQQQHMEEYPLAQPNMMSLEQAIHSLEMEGEQGAAGAVVGHPPHARRELPDDYDAILTGGDQHRRHHHHPHQHVQQPPHPRHQQHQHHHQTSSRNMDDRHYHHPPAAPPQQQNQKDIVFDRYQARDRERDRGAHHMQQPPPPTHHHGQYDGTRLMFPVDVVEFPTEWDGREIEPTNDDELLDRDEDEYYRRRAAYRQQQQSQQSMQSHSLQSQSLQSQSQSAQRNRNPISRVHSSLSRESMPFGQQYATDIYSQTMAHNGRRVPMQIEVSPGVSMPFRGSEETWEAIALNRIVRTSCLGCSIQLYCVEDAELVVCPDCQTMSPAHATEDPNAKRTGLGLGFKEEQLVQWRNAGP